MANAPAIQGIVGGLNQSMGTLMEYAKSERKRAVEEPMQQMQMNQLQRQEAVGKQQFEEWQKDQQKVKKEDLEKANPYTPYLIEAAKASGLIMGDEQEFTRGKIKESMAHFNENPIILASVIDKSYQTNLAKDKQYEIAIQEEQKKLPELMQNPIGNAKKIEDIQNKISEYEKTRKPFSDGRMRDSQLKDNVQLMVQAKFYEKLPAEDKVVYQSLVDQGIKMPSAEQILQKKAQMKTEQASEKADHYTIKNKKSGEVKSVRLKPGESIPKGWDITSTASSEMTLTPEALTALSQRFGTTGEIPGMGMGKAATEARTKVLNQWAEDLKKSGETPQDQLANQAAYKASVAELKRLQGQRGPVMAFAKTADLNLKNAERLSEKVDRTGVPVLNRWILAGKKSIAGDPDVAAFDAALRTGINEYAKVVSSATGGGVTSDTARKEVEEMLNKASTKEQIKSIMKEVIAPDLKNRKTGYDQQIQFIKESIAGRGKGTSEEQLGTPQDYEEVKTIGDKQYGRKGGKWYAL